MSFPHSYRKEINNSTPNHGDIETFTVTADTKSKSLACDLLYEYTLWESVAQTPFFKNLKITAEEGYKRCMADEKCKEFAQPYLRRGFIFQASHRSLKAIIARKA